MSSPSSQNTSSPTQLGNDEDDIELARGLAETDLKSENEEIFFSYGDKMLLDGVSASEDADGDGSVITTEMVQDGDAIRLLSPAKPKPAQASWSAPKIRFYVDGRLYEKEAFFGQNQGKGNTEEDDIEDETEEEEEKEEEVSHSEEFDFSSLAPDDSYSSLADYLVSLEKKKVVYAGGTLTKDDEKKIVSEAVATAAAISSLNLITSSKQSPSTEE